jgi:hypothetical protein
MLLSYPIVIAEDGHRHIRATCPDFPEFNIVVKRRLVVLRSAADALDEIVAARLGRGDTIPKPSPGQPRAALSVMMESRVRNQRAK